MSTVDVERSYLLVNCFGHMSGVMRQYCVRDELHLPNEILAMIINKLVSDKKCYIGDKTLRTALASCRLASRVLCSIATPLLFFFVEIIDQPTNDQNKSRVERTTRFKQFLTTTTSNIAASVHTLDMTLFCYEVNFGAINGALISEILHLLQNIQTFVLDCGGWAPVGFPAIPGDLASAIEALCRSPKLTTLNLSNVVDFPIAVIDTCPNLQYLGLRNVKFGHDHRNPIKTSSPQPYNLDRLEVEYDYDFSDSSFYGDTPFPQCFSGIKNLHLKDLCWDEATFRHGWKIMLLASQSITTIDLTRVDKTSAATVFPESLEGGLFDLGRLPALRHFKIQLPISLEDTGIMLHFLNQLLSSSTSGIETLEIIISWDWAESENNLFSSDNTGWSTLDKLLSSKKFASLEKVVLGFVLYPWSPRLELERSFISYVDTLFPTFRALTSARLTLELDVKVIPLQPT